MRLPNALHTIVAAVVTGAAITAAATAGAQQSAPSSSALAVGDEIRLRTVVFDTTGSGVTCDASVASVKADTAVLDQAAARRFLRPSLVCPSHAFAPGDITELSVVRGDRGSRLSHAGLGAVAGAFLGGVYARISTSGGGPNRNHEDDGIIAVVGVEIGALAGGLVGLALPAGKRWERVRNIPPIRIARFTLHPGVRVAMSPPTGP
ncbi:MAG: hypothetical protein ACR2GG_02010 [Gemmatimonadaceae bacterium]